MTRSVDEKTAAELERLELLLMDPALPRDREAVAALLAEDFFEFGSSGRMWTRETTLELLATESYSRPNAEGFTCRALAPNAVLLTYRTLREGEHGKPVTTLRSSIWLNATGIADGWKICFHQGTRAAD
jgi:hypothetical protein